MIKYDGNDPAENCQVCVHFRPSRPRPASADGEPVGDCLEHPHHNGMLWYCPCDSFTPATAKQEPAAPVVPPTAGHGADSEAAGTKDTNPKDALGSLRLPLHLVPPATTAYACLAHLNGALKYGAHNWRFAGVRFSVYLDAMERHLKKLRDGEWADEEGVPHLSSILADAGIILDAKHCGKLEDDRPPRADVSGLFAELTPHVARLKELHKGRNPRHFTIADSEAA